MQSDQHKSEEWLRGRYVDDRLTTTQIAAECGVSHKTISRYLHKFSIPVREPQLAQVGMHALSKRRTMLSDIRDYSMKSE